MTSPALHLMASYLTDRTQWVKVGSITSKWNIIRKGVPQGSIIGPLTFNLFINDIFDTVKDGKLINYADDNTVLVTGNDINSTIDKLQRECENILKWVEANEMEDNPQKFQVLISKEENRISIRCGNGNITSEKSTKLLGVHLDINLGF